MVDRIEVNELVERIALLLTKYAQSVTTVESCTGGGIAHALTAVAGSSQWFNQSFVTYSNSAKVKLAGVSQSDLEQFGAVSSEVARGMALGGQLAASADYALSVTGIAGPDGGSVEKPVGTVWFGWALPGKTCETDLQVFPGDRDEVRARSVQHSLKKLLQYLDAE